MGRSRAILMDLCGTLCDGNEYLELGDRGYHHAATTIARANPKMVEVCQQAVADGEAVLILTGRTDEWQPAGEVWAHERGVEFTEFHSRTRRDYRPNRVFKREVVEELLTRYDITAAYDDDPRNIAVFEELGILSTLVGDEFDWRLV